MSPSSHSGEPLTLTALRPAPGGEAIAHHAGRVVFLSGALPGETVEAEVTHTTAKVLRARTLSVVEPSEHRVADRRDGLGVPGAGGIELAHARLAYSRAFKEEAAASQLERIGGLDPAALGFRVLPAPTEAAADDDDLRAGTQWRTRVQLNADEDGHLGMLAAGSSTAVPLRTETVPLAVPEISALGLAQRSFPDLRRIEIAVTGGGGGALVLRGSRAREHAQDLAAEASAWSGDWSVFAAPEPAGRGRARGRGRGAAARNRGGASAGELQLVSGTGVLTETVPGLARGLQVSGSGFWQVHRDAPAVLTAQVRRLVAEALEPGSGTVLDLYCGAGLLGIALAEDGHRVLGVEGAEDAAAHARSNAAGLSAEFRTGRVERLGNLPTAAVAVLDPPRAGAGRDVVRALADSEVETVVYVSCDPATFARDAAGLRAAGFVPCEVTGHDLFPLTGHLELVSAFRRAW